jgi:hypothetical protein
VDYVYGPVPLRGMGLSLGIDPIETRNWNGDDCRLARMRRWSIPLRSVSRLRPPAQQCKVQMRVEAEATAKSYVGRE